MITLCFTSSLQIFEEVPLHQDASGVEVDLNLLNPLSLGIQSAQSKMSDTMQKAERLDHDHAKGEVVRVRTLEDSRENERVGVEPHYEGETKDLTLNVDDVLITGSLLPEVVILPPLIKGSSQIVAPISIDSGNSDSDLFSYSKRR